MANKIKRRENGVAPEPIPLMRVSNIEHYFDGGTVAVLTTKGTYFIDRRLETETPMAVYATYPGEKESEIIDDTKLIRELYAALIRFHNKAKASKILINDLQLTYKFN